MSFLLPYSEELLLRRLESSLASYPTNPNPDLKPLRRLAQKLKLRRLQRRRGLPNMDWDKDVEARVNKLSMLNGATAEDKGGPQALDRYSIQEQAQEKRSIEVSEVEARIQMVQDLPRQVPFTSPYTGR